MKFTDIPKFTRPCPYTVNVDWKFLPSQLTHYATYNLEMIPDFQRGHVWTRQQQIDYVEFMLRGGQSGRHIYFNHPGWMGSWKGDFVVVDGLQRLTAAMAFIRGMLPAFGTLVGDFEGGYPLNQVDFIFNVNCLKTKAEVLKWYLEMNTGGTPHSKEEIERVREMLKSLDKSRLMN